MLLRLLPLLLIAVPVHAAIIEVVLPDEARATSAKATTRELGLTSPGRVNGSIVTFENLLPDTPYDVRIALVDGKILQGVDMGWYTLEAARPDAPEMTDQDKAQIDRIITQVPAFYSRSERLILRGDGDRAVALVQLIRDTPFHASGRDEVIWRIELWYFQNQAGGWEKAQQQNRVLRRERFASSQAFRAETDRLVWAPLLGGITVPRDQAIKRVELTRSEQPTASTRPAHGT